MQARTKPISGVLERNKSIPHTKTTAKEGMDFKAERKHLPNKKRQLEINKESAHCFPSYARESKFVRETSMEQFAIDTTSRTCSCRKWDISGSPCKYGVAALGLPGENPEDHVHEYYSVEAYKKHVVQSFVLQMGQIIGPFLRRFLCCLLKNLSYPEDQKKKRQREKARTR